MPRPTRTTGDNSKRLATRQSLDAAIWSICDIMRRSNCAGALQYVPELTWILFLRILDERETAEAERATSSRRRAGRLPRHWQPSGASE